MKNYVLRRKNIEVDTRWIDGVGIFERVIHKVTLGSFWNGK
jgi:hypothetical protein